MTTPAPRVVSSVVGDEAAVDTRAALHDLRHDGAVEYVHLTPEDLDRRRLRVTSDAGREYAVALPRGQSLTDGTVLILDDDRAVIVRAGAPRRLRLRAHSVPAALRLGFLAGHLHWKCDQHDDRLEVTLEAPSQDYFDRIRSLLEDGLVDVQEISSP